MDAVNECHHERNNRESVQDAVFEVWDGMILDGREEMDGVLVRALVNLIPFFHGRMRAPEIGGPPTDEFAKQQKSQSTTRDNHSRMVAPAQGCDGIAHGDGIHPSFSDAFVGLVVANVVERKEIKVGGDLVIGQMKDVEDEGGGPHRFFGNGFF